MIPSALVANIDIYSPREIPLQKFLTLANDMNLTELKREAWQSDTSQMDFGKPLKMRFLDLDGQPEHWQVFETEDGIGYVVRRGGLEQTGHVEATAASTSAEGAERILTLVKEALPLTTRPDGDVIRVTFWNMGKNGPRTTQRKIAVSRFETIENNYPPEVRAQLKRMVGPDFQPGRGGQLLLWHGTPGTGKTYALRALAREWREWCDIDYIVDPDAFFSEASYLMQVLLANPANVGPVDDEDEDPASEGPKRWRLLVFEDTGELLAADARERTGQGLSRLLNVVDGFIGQGLRILLLITTNEELSKLHDAVARPGRCAVNIPFKPLTVNVARRWAEEHGLDARIDAPKTLADLYAQMEGWDEGQPVVRTVGFQPTADDPAA